MSNAFTKEEKVLWEEMAPSFEDQLVFSGKVDKVNISNQTMERAGDVAWVPQPYIAQTFDGMDQTSNFQKITQLSCPATIGFETSAPWMMNAREARDAVQSGRFGEAAKRKIASDINRAVLNVASAQGSLVVPISGAAGDFDDIAQCDSIFNEQGVPMGDRHLCLSSRDYNGLANNLTTLASNMSSRKPDGAYEKGNVGKEVAGFEVTKMDYANRIAAAQGGGSLTIDTQASAGNYHTPVSTRTAATGERGNIDNRFQTITVSSTTNVVAGDAFTIAGVYAVHHETKQSTGELKTFRVIEVLTSTTMIITSAIVSNQGNTDAEAQYQNVIVEPSATAAIVFLNANATNINPFWYRDAIAIVPGAYQVDANAGAGVMRYTTSIGIELVFQKQYDIDNMETKYRLDALYGVVNKAPEMSGILLFNQ